MKSRRVTELQRDRLSSLPESLIIGILSFLEFKEAVKTCVLSKQWRSVWLQLPTLEFKERSSKSVEIVNRLISAGGRYGTVKTFSVELDYQTRFASDVNAWIEFAAANKVENLSLCLHAAEPEEELFRLPPCLGWRCLRTLSLSGVSMTSQEELDNLLSRCSALETLELIQCRGFHRVDVGNPSFRRLRVVNPSRIGDDCVRKISAAHMRELEVSTKTPFSVGNVQSLHQASIDISNYESEVQDYMRVPEYLNLINELKRMYRIILLKLFDAIRHVNKLELRGDCIQVISEVAKRPNFEFPKFMRLQNLAICAANRHISGIGTLLRSSPNLDNLLISFLETASDKKVEIEANELDKWDELLHVKFVDIAFTDNTTMKLAQIILEKAPLLEQMVIRNASFSSTNSRYFNEKCEALLRHPKSSKKAKVRIHQ